MHNPPPTLPRKRSQSNGLIHNAVIINNGPLSSELPHAGESSSPLPAVPIFKLKGPRPDICIGLSDNSLIKDFEPGMRSCAARSFLFDLQDTATLISDPHVTPLGLRFPFLIVEAKAGANWREPLPGSKSSCSRQFNCSSDSSKTIGTKICPKFWKGKFTMILRPARCHLRACPTSHQTWSFFHYEKPDSRTAGPPPETRRR